MGATVVTDVAPVVALLLEAIVFDGVSWDVNAIVDMQKSILSRIIGCGSIGGPIDIGVILDRFVDTFDQSDSSAVMTWIDPQSGKIVKFTLQHAIDFAYYVAGTVTPVPPTT